jgi:uncharacterized membrane protein
VSTIEKSIDVDVPASTAYNQWTQFEEFPRFMDDVERVVQLDDTTLQWRARIGGRTEEWTARISEQIPDKRVAWHSLDGAPNAGVVTFHRLADDRTRVMLQLDYEPQGAIENVGDWLGVVSHGVERDLENFKHFIEDRGRETGSWRGEVRSPDER